VAGILITVWPAVGVAQGLPDDLNEIPGVQEQLKSAAQDRAVALDRRARVDIVQAGAIDPATYVLGPGDQLEINIWGKITRTIPVEVSPEGILFIPARGPIDVRGKTLAWARDRITSYLSDQYVGVKGDIRLVHLRTFKVYVSGEVKTTGAVEVNSATRATEAIAQAAVTDLASRRNIVVSHLDGSSNRVDIELFERLGRQELNPMLLDGDRIVVPRATEFVEIAGAFARPGRVELAPGDSLGTMVTLTGGLLPSAGQEQALMVRFNNATERESVLVNLQEPTVLATPLRDGDRLFVQFRPEYHRLPTVGITGEIDKPGTYPIVTGRDRLSDLIVWAGGFRSQANRSAVHLLREPPATNERDPELDRLARLSREQMTESEYTKLETKLAEHQNSFRIDCGQVKPGSSADPLLQEGDVVQVDRFVPSVRIEGQVGRPGLVDYADGRSLSEYIQLAGGFTQRSSRSSVRVSRGLTGQIIPARGLKGIQPGDFIWVPERRDVDAWAAFREIVTVAGSVALIIFTLSQ